MRTVKTRSAGLIAIIPDAMPISTAIDTVKTFYPEINIVFQESEYQRALKLGASFIQDPEAQKSFYETLFKKKAECSTYELSQDFPLEIPEPKTEKEALARKYGGEILEMLRGRKRVEAKPEE